MGEVGVFCRGMIEIGDVIQDSSGNRAIVREMRPTTFGCEVLGTGELISISCDGVRERPTPAHWHLIRGSSE